MSLRDRLGADRRNRNALDLYDIQATVLRHRPEPYFGTHLFLHINDAGGGRELLRRLGPHIVSAADLWDPRDAWIAGAITYPRFVAMDVPEGSLRRLPEAFPTRM